jgi:hypothetical protein
MAVETERKSHPLTNYIQITGHSSSESGEPFLRLEIKRKRILVRVNSLLGDRGAPLLDLTAQKEQIARIERWERYLRPVAHMTSPGRQLLRLHGKFATVYAAGCAAIRFKILPFTEADLLAAVKTCERAHIAFSAKEFGGASALHARPTAPAPPRGPYQGLKTYLSSPVAQTFIDLRNGSSVPPGHVHASAPGYLGLYRGNKEIWLSFACFERIAGGSAAAKALMAELHAKGLIASERRRQRRSFSVKREIRGLGRARVIALRAR